MTMTLTKINGSKVTMDGLNKNSSISLSNLLDDCRVGKGEDFTHTLITGKSFYVKPELYDDFMDAYATELKKGSPLYLTEKHRDIGPLLIDLDFRQREQDRLYGQEDILKFLKRYDQEVRRFFGDEAKRHYYVMEKPAPKQKKDLVADGVHIMCPFIVCRPAVQYIIRENMLSVVKELFEGKYINKAADIIDRAVIEKNNWFMYGSKKQEDAVGYTISYIYDATEDNIIPFKPTFDREIVELMSIRNKYTPSPIVDDKQGEVEEYVKKQEETQKAKEEAVAKKKERAVVDDPIMNEEQYHLATCFVAMLSKTRADDYPSWIRVGWCLRNIDYRLLREWIEFSKLSTKFQEGVCEKEWDKMKCEGGLGMGSLRRWAKEDSPKQYSFFLETSLGTLVRACCPNKTEYDVARVVQRKYEGLFAYDTKQGVWYKFVRHRWVVDDKGLSLKGLLPVEVNDVFRKAQGRASNEAAVTDDTAEKERLDQLALCYGQIVVKLKTPKYQMGIMSQLEMLFGDAKFSEMLDTKPNLIGFENGVFDLDEWEFREGRSEDMITKTTNYNYTDETDEKVRDEIMNLMYSIHHTKEMAHYMLYTLATNLHGTKYHELVYFWVGRGRNGKGMTMSLFDMALGEYFYACPITMFTKVKQSSSQASPDIMKLKGVRCISATEPEESESLQSGFIKQLSGNDKVAARSLYNNLVNEFKLQGQIFVQMNKMARLSAVDKAMAERLRVLRFPYMFVAEPKLPHEKQIDFTLKNKFDNDVRYRQTFMNVLLSMYKEFREGGYNINTPKEVRDEANAYLEENDAVKNFLMDKYSRCEDGIIKGKYLLEMFVKTTGVKKSASSFYEDVENAGFKVVKKYSERPYKNQAVVLGIQEGHDDEENGDLLIDG